MRLCYLASGNSIHTQRWVSYFVDKGYDVHLITDRPFEYRTLRNHSLKQFTRNRAFNLLAWSARIKGMVKDIRPDILHSHYAASYGVLGQRTGFHPHVVTVWGSDILVEPKKSIIHKRAVRSVLKHADLITCDGDHMKGPLTALSADPSKINIIFFGTDVAKFSPDKRDENLVKQLGVAGSPVIISTRKHEPIYDIQTLVRAIPTVLETVPSARFVIAGTGSLRSELEALVRQLGVDACVIFVGDIPNADLSRYLASADVYVSTSTSDAGLAASTAEAMACGLPVIVTDFGDNRGWVDDNVNGFVVPVSQPQALAEKIVQLLRNRETAAEFGRKSRDIIKERNNYATQMEKVDGLYRELV